MHGAGRVRASERADFDYVIAHPSRCIRLRADTRVYPIVLTTSALLLLASLFASASPPPARPAADSVQTRLQQLADSVVAARPRMPGIIIAVEQPATGKRWSVAAGLADTAR